LIPSYHGTINKTLIVLHSETRKCIEEIIKYTKTEKDLYRLIKPNRLSWWYVEDEYYGLHNKQPDIIELKTDIGK
jgi:hypothetical protein